MDNKKIRVLHVAQAAGGVDRYLKMLFKYMDKEAVENMLVASNDYVKSEYEGLLSDFQYLEMKRAIGFSDLSAVFKLRALIKKYRPDIVYGHSSKAGAIARMANIGLSSKCIYNPHGWAFNMRCSRVKKVIYTVIEKVAAPFCKKIICISEAEKISALGKNICSEKKLQVIYNGVDVEEYEANKHGLIKRSDLGIPDDAFVIGMVGRISQQKAPDIFIRTAKEVKAIIPNAYFIIVGDGEMKAEIIDYAKNNNLIDCLYITGWVSNPLDYVELFDVACLLSRWEGFGLVLPEYMMAGKPIVATSVDAIPFIIKNKSNGLLVNVDDVTDTVDAISRIHSDLHLRNMLVSQGKMDVNTKFNVKRVSKEHEDVFKKIIGM